MPLRTQKIPGYYKAPTAPPVPTQQTPAQQPPAPAAPPVGASIDEFRTRGERARAKVMRGMEKMKNLKNKIPGLGRHSQNNPLPQERPAPRPQQGEQARRRQAQIPPTAQEIHRNSSNSSSTDAVADFEHIRNTDQTATSLRPRPAQRQPLGSKAQNRSSSKPLAQGAIQTDESISKRPPSPDPSPISGKGEKCNSALSAPLTPVAQSGLKAAHRFESPPAAKVHPSPSSSNKSSPLKRLHALNLLPESLTNAAPTEIQPQVPDLPAITTSSRPQAAENVNDAHNNGQESQEVWTHFIQNRNQTHLELIGTDFTALPEPLPHKTQSFKLTHNPHLDTPPDISQCLDRLQTLHLDGNTALTRLPAQLGHQTPALHELSLTQCPIANWANSGVFALNRNCKITLDESARPQIESTIADIRESDRSYEPAHFNFVGTQFQLPPAPSCITSAQRDENWLQFTEDPGNEGARPPYPPLEPPTWLHSNKSMAAADSPTRAAQTQSPPQSPDVPTSTTSTRPTEPTQAVESVNADLPPKQVWKNAVRNKNASVDESARPAADKQTNSPTQTPARLARTTSEHSEVNSHALVENANDDIAPPLPGGSSTPQQVWAHFLQDPKQTAVELVGTDFTALSEPLPAKTTSFVLLDNPKLNTPPDISQCLESLQELHLDGNTALTSLPPNLHRAKALRELGLTQCPIEDWATSGALELDASCNVHVHEDTMLEIENAISDFQAHNPGHQSPRFHPVWTSPSPSQSEDHTVDSLVQRNLDWMSASEDSDTESIASQEPSSAAKLSQQTKPGVDIEPQPKARLSMQRLQTGVNIAPQTHAAPQIGSAEKTSSGAYGQRSMQDRIRIFEKKPANPNKPEGAALGAVGQRHLPRNFGTSNLSSASALAPKNTQPIKPDTSRTPPRSQPLNIERTKLHQDNFHAMVNHPGWGELMRKNLSAFEQTPVATSAPTGDANDENITTIDLTRPPKPGV